jgi:hypothetical protein
MLDDPGLDPEELREAYFGPQSLLATAEQVTLIRGAGG